MLALFTDALSCLCVIGRKDWLWLWSVVKLRHSGKLRNVLCRSVDFWVENLTRNLPNTNREVWRVLYLCSAGVYTDRISLGIPICPAVAAHDVCDRLFQPVISWDVASDPALCLYMRTCQLSVLPTHALLASPHLYAQSTELQRTVGASRVK
jgi:hypothetical protein